MNSGNTYAQGAIMTKRLAPITRKGQVTIPAEIRRTLGLKQGDKVAFKLEGKEARIVPAPSPVDESFQVVPALKPPRSWKEIEEIAHEEAALEAAKEGLPQ